MTIAEPTNGFLLEARGISKLYGGTTALMDVDFRLERGRVHALTGENGAGKSTLVKILAGVEQPTKGSLLLESREIALRSSRDAAAQGIALIHQELQLFPDMSVADNLFLGQELVGRWRTIGRTRQERIARETLASLGQDVDPCAIIGSLPLGVQQIVEIGRALVRETRVLLMDEPTSALSPAEVRVLFDVIRGLTAGGVAIVYISHRLQELLAVADSITVLRDGRLVGAAAASAVDVRWIVERMTGRATSIPTDVGKVPSARQTVLAVRQLNLAPAPGRASLQDVSFDLEAGEIIGVYGSMGAGRTELLESLIGLQHEATGAISLGNRRVDYLPIDRRIAAGINIIPEDRQRAGLVPTFSVLHNLTLSSLRQFARLGYLSPAAEERAALRVAADVKLKTPAMDAPVTSLSGGNQQKVIIARALMSRPRVLLMDEPSRGVDVGARMEIIQCMRGLAGSGMAIIFTSSDLDEILAASTRVFVLCRGRLVAEYPVGDASDAAIAAAASGEIPNVTIDGRMSIGHPAALFNDD